MAPKKNPHAKGDTQETLPSTEDPWSPYDFSKFDAFLTGAREEEGSNRVKRKAKNARRFNTLSGPKLRERPNHYLYPEPVKDRVLEYTTTTRKPGILPETMNPGVIFRVRMSDAILRIKQRMYEDPERHIEADIIYTNLIKKVRRRGHGRKRTKVRSSTTASDQELNHTSTVSVPIARRADLSETQQGKGRKRKKQGRSRERSDYDLYEPPIKGFESSFVEMPKDLYQAHLRPGVIFRIHMSEAILKMQYRNYGEDKDESVIEADVEYLRLTRKVINDEITKFEDLKWLVSWFNNRSELVQEHMCNTRYYAVGIPPTMFTHSEEYMKRMCLFDNVYLDHIPYVVGEDGSLMAAVAPPVLHCDAATCTSVPFIDSVMFDERLSRTNVRTVTRCQASCRAHCRNDPDCLKRCSDRCLRAD
ncbi:uncharacterized protein LOC120635130 [Pararge aegeria]|uniref:uncharacterized protein LOC120635130 n=1 Tax=Pararge aegeria TaxID=116150 RepID=UPI0019D0613C|nr:uncharacterized protein LOC120635130 [Pararge aegeria]